MSLKQPINMTCPLCTQGWETIGCVISEQARIPFRKLRLKTSLACSINTETEISPPYDLSTPTGQDNLLLHLLGHPKSVRSCQLLFVEPLQEVPLKSTETAHRFQIVCTW